MAYLILKAFHLIFIVTWFAGLFYIVRLFVYQAEASQLSDQKKKTILTEQFRIMQRRLWYGITWPSAMLTLGLGATLILKYYDPLDLPKWLILKLFLLSLLYAYHLSCELIYRQQRNSIYEYSPYQLRLWNELATLFLFSIVFTALFKNQITVWGIAGGILVLTALLLVSVKVYARKRRASQNQPPKDS